MIQKKALRLPARLLILTLFLSLLPLGVLAQQGTSDIVGTVTDPEGKVIVGATVTLKNSDTGFSRNQTTTDKGVFSFNGIPTGNYAVEVEANGFKKAVSNAVQALVAKTTSLTIQLELGNVSEVVNVTAGANEILINNTDASLGNNFNATQISQLPTNARNVGSLLSLQPGVTRDGYVAGGRSDQANLTLDGVDVNDNQNGSTFAPVVRVNPDSVEEFRVTTVNANASQGRSSGAQVQLVTKSGTNEFHGSLYEYHRNTVTTANDFFNNSAGIERPALIRNLFGGRIGGPIKKDRFFFFYNYEGLREAKQGTVVQTVPLPSLAQGSVKFINAAGSVVTLTTAQINNLRSGSNAVVDENPIGLAVLAGAVARYPANDFTVGDGLNTAGFRFNAPLPVRQNASTARLDYKLNDSNTLTFRMNYQQDNFARAAQQFPDTAPLTTWSHPIGILASHSWVINDRLVNNFRFGLTRDAFTNAGDATENTIDFRAVYTPKAFAYTFARVTPTYNFTDDISWTKGNHSFQFGTNIRTIRNRRTNFAPGVDTGRINAFFYSGSGKVLTSPIKAAGFTVRSDFDDPLKHAMAAVLGRLSQYSANYQFDKNLTLLPAGSAIKRTYATEEYDFYVQDTWKITQNLTANLGLRYGLSRPVYEANGVQASPDIPLQDYLQRRIEASFNGQNYDQPLKIDLSGPVNGRPGFYKMDKNNFQPRVSLAWSPNFRSGFLGKLFGADQTSVIRGGFAMTNDYFGQALAVNFDANGRIGFASSSNISANTFNISTNPGPLYTGPNMAIRGLPVITTPSGLKFPVQQPSDGQRRIEGSLDTSLVSPINYNFNFTISRKLPAGFLVEGSYIGRLARHLLATRDVMQPNDIRDPVSGQTWYQAATILEQLRVARTPISKIPNLPFFDHFYKKGSLDDLLFGAGLSNTQAIYGFMATTDDTPGCIEIGGCYDAAPDWTYLQDVLDGNTDQQLFYNTQYGALSSYATIAHSDYHGFALTVRQRVKGFTWDFNYTLSKSIDDASGLQTSGVYGAAFILNALRPRDNRTVSDFDIRHIMNFNSIWEIPVGRGQKFLGGLPKWADAFFGGWQLSNIFRYNSGEVVGGVNSSGGWPTNWNLQSFAVRIREVKTDFVKNGKTGPNLFSDPVAAYRSFRTAGPGETGDRNIDTLRYPGYIVLDMGLDKRFKLPFEGHSLQFRWETFNVTNTQRLTSVEGNSFSIGLDPQLGGNPQRAFGNLTGIQGSPRVMQFALRYEF